MAKKTEDLLDDMEANEKQVPEKPKKSGGMKLPMVIGIIFGVIVTQVILIFVLFKLFLGQPATVTPDGTVVQQTTEKSEKNSKKIEKTEEEEEILTEEEQQKIQFQETGRITTNPKSSSAFVVINLGLYFLAKDEKINEEFKKEIDKSPVWKRLSSDTKEIVNITFGNYTVEDLRSMKRDSLKTIFMKQLKPVFKTSKIILKDVKLIEYLIQ